jgi:hypothetical protein
MTNGESDDRSLPARASPGVSRAINVKPNTRKFPKVEVQANAPTCFSNTAHASGPYFSFHSV